MNYSFKNNNKINKSNAKDVLLEIENFFSTDTPPINYIPDIFPEKINSNFKYSQYENKIFKKNKFNIIDKILFSFLIFSIYDEDIYIFEKLKNNKLYFNYNLSIKKLYKYIKKNLKSKKSKYNCCILFYNLNIVFYVGDLGITYFSLIDNNSNIKIINSIFIKNGFFIKEY